MKKTILYFSDCPFFGGSENMLVNFFCSTNLKQFYNLILLYPKNEVYQLEMEKRICSENTLSIALLRHIDKIDFVRSKVAIIKKIQYFFWAFIMVISRYPIIIINILRFYKQFKNIDFDILHINNGGYPAAISCYSAVIASRLTGHKHIVYVINNIPVGYTNILRWLDWPLDRYIGKVVSRFITGSENAGKYAEKVLKISRKRTTIHNGIVDRPIVIQKDKLKKEIGLSGGLTVFSTVANLEDRKGHIYLFHAIKELVDKNMFTNAVFLIIGDGICKAELESYIKCNNLEKYILMLGAKRNIFDFYNILDVFVLPSIGFEDFPNSILECMKLGVPTIASSIGGIPEQIVNGKTGIMVDAKNVEQLKDAILKLLNEKELRHSMAEKCVVRYNAKFTVTLSLQNYIKLYDELY